MNTARTAISKPAPWPAPPRRRNAFTLIELLVVIGIIALLAAMIVGLAKYASDKKKVTRVEAELTKWVTMIDYYHAKMGFYPPSNPNTNLYGLNSLYYELSGTILNSLTYTVQGTTNRVDSNVVVAAFSLNGFINSAAGNAATDGGEVKRFGTIPQTDVIDVYDPDWGGSVKVPRVPVDGPGPFNDGPTRTNTWFYNCVNPVHNPNSYDLWAVYYIGNDLRTNGNWKR